MPDTNETEQTQKTKKTTRKSTSQIKKIKRAENIRIAYKRDKAKLSQDAEKDIAAIDGLLDSISQKEKRRAELELELGRLILDQQADYKQLTKHSANMGRHADTAFGVGSAEASDYRKDD